MSPFPDTLINITLNYYLSVYIYIHTIFVFNSATDIGNTINNWILKVANGSINFVK